MSSGPELVTSKITDPAAIAVLSSATENSLSVTLTVPPPAAQPAARTVPIIERARGLTRARRSRRTVGRVLMVCSSCGF
jgi:hypothetical protein